MPGAWRLFAVLQPFTSCTLDEQGKGGTRTSHVVARQIVAHSSSVVVATGDVGKFRFFVLDCEGRLR